MRYTRWAALGTLLMGASAVCAPPAKPTAARSRPAGAGPRSLMALMESKFLNEPVVACGIGFRLSGMDETKTPPTDGPLLGGLQAAGEAFSNARNQLIPFQVGKSWALAPAMMETDGAAGRDAFDAMGEGLRMDVALASLTDEQIKKLGSPEGLRVSDLAPLAQTALARALRPPLQMPDGSIRREPLDFRNARLKGRLRLLGVSIPFTGGTMFLRFSDSQEPELRPLNASAQLRSVSPPGLQSVPNRFKPTDLEGKNLTKPIGIQGVYRLDDAMKEVGRATGLHLRAASMFRGVPVFVGSRKMTAGDVLDGLRLGVTGAFRHVGSDYILAWDRKGLGAVQESVTESNTFAGEASRLEDTTDRVEPWLTMANQLPYDEDDPLGLTPEQQERLFDVRGNPFFEDPSHTLHDNYDPLTLKVPFADMTQSQHSALRATVGVKQLWTPRGMHTVTAEDVQNSFLQNDGYITVSLSVAGGPWMRLESFGFGEIQGYSFAWRNHREKMEQGWERDRKAAESTPAPAPKPKSLPTKERGLMTPALGPGRLTSLAKQMHRHGLNVLFYPALDDGYASFPSRVFPLAPALREKDGLAAAIAAMKAEGIRVVPYVSVLAWQRLPESEPHWMSKHPDWLDCDILGRTRLDWAEEHPDGFGGIQDRILEAQGVVRASEPKVIAKLKTLMDELLAVPGLDGVCLMDWNPAASRAPRLGFAMPDRVAAIAAGDDDPVDLPINPANPGDPFWPEEFEGLGVHRPDNKRAATATDTPAEALARSLLAMAKQHKPALETFLQGSRPALLTGRREPARPVLTEDVSLIPASYLDPFMTSGILLPAWPRSMVPPSFPAEKRDYPAVVSLTFRPGGPDFPTTFGSPIAVLDMRAAPDEIESSLGWITEIPHAKDAPLAEVTP